MTDAVVRRMILDAIHDALVPIHTTLHNLTVSERNLTEELSSRIRKLEDRFNYHMDLAHSTNPTPDPRIGRLCWVSDINPESRQMAVPIVDVSITEARGKRFKDVRGSFWVHATPVDTADLERRP